MILSAFSSQVISTSIFRTMENHSNTNGKSSIAPIFKNRNNTSSKVHTSMNSTKPSTGGWKTFGFWALITFVCLLAWANMILTVVVFRVLHLGQGLESLELMPNHGIVKFYGDSFFGSLFKPDGKIRGFGNTPFEIKGVNNGSISLGVEDHKGRVQSTFKVEKNGTHIHGVNDFIVGHSFSAVTPNFKMSKLSRHIKAEVVSTNRITSEKNASLELKSDLFTRLSGSEGTLIDGKEILLTADQQVLLKSLNGSIILGGKDGIAINAGKIPIARTRSISTLTTQYKVCVCMPEGKLFRVPVSKDQNSHSACYNIDFSPTMNPCLY